MKKINFIPLRPNLDEYDSNYNRDNKDNYRQVYSEANDNSTLKFLPI